MAEQTLGARGLPWAPGCGRVVALAEEVDEVALDAARVLELIDEERIDLPPGDAGDLGPIAEAGLRDAEQVAEAQSPGPPAGGGEARPRELEQGHELYFARGQLGALAQVRGEAERPIRVRGAREALSKGVELLVGRGLSAPRHVEGEELEGEGGGRIREGLAGGAALEAVFEGLGERDERAAPGLGAPARDGVELAPQVGGLIGVIGAGEVLWRDALFVEAVEEARDLAVGRRDAAARDDERAGGLGSGAAFGEGFGEGLVDGEDAEGLGLVFVEHARARGDPQIQGVALHDFPSGAVERVDPRGGPFGEGFARVLSNIGGLGEGLSFHRQGRPEPGAKAGEASSDLAREGELDLGDAVPRGEGAEGALDAPRDLKGRCARERGREDAVGQDGRGGRARVGLAGGREAERQEHIEGREPVRLARAGARGDDDVPLEGEDRRVAPGEEGQLRRGRGRHVSSSSSTGITAGRRQTSRTSHRSQRLTRTGLGAASPSHSFSTTSRAAFAAASMSARAITCAARSRGHSSISPRFFTAR
jgi:hypothetical protein